MYYSNETHHIAHPFNMLSLVRCYNIKLYESNNLYDTICCHTKGDDGFSFESRSQVSCRDQIGRTQHWAIAGAPADVLDSVCSSASEAMAKASISTPDNKTVLKLLMVYGKHCISQVSERIQGDTCHQLVCTIHLFYLSGYQTRTRFQKPIQTGGENADGKNILLSKQPFAVQLFPFNDRLQVYEIVLFSLNSQFVSHSQCSLGSHQPYAVT